jgi:predicted MFS family arabinose efflux permease
VKRPRVGPDARRVLVAQAVRGFLYGFAAILLGTTLRRLGFSTVEVGLVLGSVVAGTVVASLLVARFGEHWGRRRTYAGLFAALVPVGVVFAFAEEWWALALVALLGVLSTEVVESGPFTSLEQSMLSNELEGDELVRGLGIYNAVATAAGALGALAAGLPGILRDVWDGGPPDQRWFLLLVPGGLIGALVARSLSRAVELGVHEEKSARLDRSRGVVARLAALFALDSFAGGFIVQSFLAFFLAAEFDASAATIGAVFFGVGILQTVSFLLAPRIARRIGLVPTMVFTHLPSNVLLIALAFAPSLGVAIALLLTRTCLGQMDVPTRQAYVMAVVYPSERVAAAAYTNTARYAARPVGPVLAGAASAATLGLPLVLAGGMKIVYDLLLWRSFGDRPPSPTP